MVPGLSELQTESQSHVGSVPGERRFNSSLLAFHLCGCVCVNNDFATTTVSVSSGGVGRERDGFKVKEEETRKKNALNFFKGETFF